jgi:ribosomal RNA-processing protein 9
VGLWSTKKKRPTCIYSKAHGKDAPWVTSVASMKFSDIFASGSSDGHLNLWNSNINGQKITRISNLEIPGFINGLCFPKSGRFLVAAVGQEHRLGRWWRNTNVRNSIQIIPLPSLD